jgi:hypothetical protein
MAAYGFSRASYFIAYLLLLFLVRAIGYPTLGGFPYFYAGEGNRGTS